ncbi:MAG: AAA family ATPase [Candidatus Omnitrophica bacterium]|nr:AAA family ATPase [Candidatus Omnitrophota bacterium]
MIKHLEIKNFKSLKEISLNCKRINLFIGEPNSGKSNILESIGLFSFTDKLKDFVRYERITNLFYDENLEETINIKLDTKELEIKKHGEQILGGAIEKRGQTPSNGHYQLFSFQADYSSLRGWSGINPCSLIIKFYRFKIMDLFNAHDIAFLNPPYGDNLLTIISINKKLKSFISDIFTPFGYKLFLRPQENKIEILKYDEKENISISLPYSLVSDTFQRIIFYWTAINTNKDSVLIFEEPESQTFPYYTKFLAETIALDKNNQYFLTTHNPYFLLSLLEKTPKEEIGIFITYYKNYQTKIKELSEEEKIKILDFEKDAFFNIEKFIE